MPSSHGHSAPLLLSRLGLIPVITLGFFFVFVSTASAATNVYYSVGQSSANRMTGSPHVTVSGNTATFTVAQTANIGVGDVVIYGAPAKTAYISGKLTSDDTQWSLVTATGTTPIATTTATVTSIKHAFTSLSAAISGASGATFMNTSNLVTGNYILNIACYYDSGPDTTAVSIPATYTTGASDYINIFTPTSTSTQANNSQRHQGKWVTSGAYLLTSTSQFNIKLLTNYVRITGLEMTNTYASNFARAIMLDSLTGSGGYIVVDSNIIRDLASSGSLSDPEGFGDTGATAQPTMVVINNEVNGFTTTAAAKGAGILVEGGTAYVYNNTTWNNNYGYEVAGLSTLTTTVFYKNDIAQGDIQGYVTTGSAVDPSSTNNLSDRIDAPGGNSHNEATVIFANASARDLHLSMVDTSARDEGAYLSTDPNYAFNYDIDGQSRPSGPAWDIGADEYVQTTLAAPTMTAFTMASTSASRLVPIAAFSASDPSRDGVPHQRIRFYTIN